MDTSDCGIGTAADYDLTVGFSTGEGKSFQGTYSWGESSPNLAGSIINGDKYGEPNITTGIDNIKLENYKVYPNPFSDHITIDSPNNTISMIEKYDAKENVIVKQETNKDTINLAELSTGINVLKITDSKNKTRQMKIIKQ